MSSQSSSRFFTLLVLLTVVCVWGRPNLVSGQVLVENDSPELSVPFQLNRLEWSSLWLKTSALGLSASASVSIKQVFLDGLADDLIETSRASQIMPNGRHILLADHHTFAIGKNSRDQLWFAADTAAALQRVRVNMSPSDRRYRSYRFTETGVSRTRRKPERG